MAEPRILNVLANKFGSVDSVTKLKKIRCGVSGTANIDATVPATKVSTSTGFYLPKYSVVKDVWLKVITGDVETVAVGLSTNTDGFVVATGITNAGLKAQTVARIGAYFLTADAAATKGSIKVSKVINNESSTSRLVKFTPSTGCDTAVFEIWVEYQDLT